MNRLLKLLFMAEPPGTPAQEGAEHFGQRARVYVKIPPAFTLPLLQKWRWWAAELGTATDLESQ